jgi:hypothetical protein
LPGLPKCRGCDTGRDGPAADTWIGDTGRGTAASTGIDATDTGLAGNASHTSKSESAANTYGDGSDDCGSRLIGK